MAITKDEQRINELDTPLLDERISNDPFFDTPPEFEVSHSENIIEKLIHLSRFGNLLTLVVGNNGSGKTTLIDKLLSTVNDDCQICHIKAQPLLSIDQLFQQVMESFGEENTFTGIPLTANQYEEWAGKLAATMGNRLLIIDDAEVLSTSVLHELCQLSAMQQAKETPHLHLILFGNYDLNTILEQSAQGVLDEDGIYVIDIPSLSDDESKLWFEYLLSNLGVNYLPEQDILDDIVQKDQGNLTFLSESAEAYAAEHQDVGTFNEAPETWRISAVGYWFGSLTIIILLVLGLFFFQDEIVKLTGMGEEPPTVKQQDVSTAIHASEEAIEEDVNQVQQVTENTQQDNKLQQSDEVVEVFDEVIADQLNVTDPEIITNEVPDAMTKEISVEEPATSVMTRDEQFLISQPDTNYTVQLIGLTKESSVQAFIAKHNIPDMYYYKSFLNEKSWFIVVLGSYDNKSNASSSRASLPTELIKNGPWIKSLKIIKNEIKTAQELIGE